MKRVSLAAVLVGLTAIGIAQTQVAQEWPAYGRDPGGARFSPLTQITRANVASLKVVWRYHTGEPVFDVSRQPSLQVTPIVIDGTMQISTPLGKVIATRSGKTLPAVLQATKTGQLFVLHRETGAPMFPVEERPVPRSTIPGEEASPTQPFTTVTPPLSPHRFTAEQAFGVTPEGRAACQQLLAGLRNDGIFTPPSLEGTLVVPSNIGGAHWGGLAADEQSGIAVFPVNRIAAMVQLIPAKDFDMTAARQESNRLGQGYEYTMMEGTPYVIRRRLLLGPGHIPCTPPPFGALVAINLRTGERLWEAPLDTPNLGGPIATAGRLVFMAGTIDRIIRAFDLDTGKELWEAPLPAGGGNEFGTGDAIMAFALQ